MRCKLPDSQTGTSVEQGLARSGRFSGRPFNRLRMVMYASLCPGFEQLELKRMRGCGRKAEKDTEEPGAPCKQCNRASEALPLECSTHSLTHSRGAHLFLLHPLPHVAHRARRNSQRGITLCAQRAVGSRRPGRLCLAANVDAYRGGEHFHSLAGERFSFASLAGKGNTS